MLLIVKLLKKVYNKKNYKFYKIYKRENIMLYFVYILAGIGAGVVTGLAGLSTAVVVTPLLVSICGWNSYDAVTVALASDVLASVINIIYIL